MSDAECRAEHPLARIANTRGAVLRLSGEDCRVRGRRIDRRDVRAERRRDEGVERRVGRDVREGRRRLAVAVAPGLV